VEGDGGERGERLREHAEWKKGRFVAEEGLVEGAKLDVWKLEAKDWKEAEI
jgi:N-acetylneuraminic acid mutarotase